MGIGFNGFYWSWLYWWDVTWRIRTNRTSLSPNRKAQNTLLSDFVMFLQKWIIMEFILESMGCNNKHTPHGGSVRNSVLNAINLITLKIIYPVYFFLIKTKINKSAWVYDVL